VTSEDGLTGQDKVTDRSVTLVEYGAPGATGTSSSPSDKIMEFDQIRGLLVDINIFGSYLFSFTF